MASSEYESFMFKFKNLQYTEYKASLIFEAENGESFVTLKANLGYLPPLPPPEHRRYDHCPQAQRSAYFR